jgi:hypothetical protein
LDGFNLLYVFRLFIRSFLVEGIHPEEDEEEDEEELIESVK